jgi:predicted metal-dependent HD superfamily phosphohydrolase
MRSLGRVDDAQPEIWSAWRSLAGDGHDDVAAELLTRHAEPHRRYHTAEHVMWVLRHVRWLLTDDLDRDAIIAAALFHDAIYDPHSATNEADSAELAVDRLRLLGWSNARLGDVAALINATAGHEATGTATAVLLDADLAVLGTQPDDYAEYVAGVRYEYGHVPDEQWRVGRAAVLRTFVDRPRIYATATMFEAREAQARLNLTSEIDSLATSMP